MSVIQALVARQRSGEEFGGGWIARLGPAATAGAACADPISGAKLPWVGEAGDRAGRPWDGVCQVSLFPSEGEEARLK